MSGNKGKQPQREDSAGASSRDTQQEQQQREPESRESSGYPRIQVNSLLSDTSGSTSIPKGSPSNPPLRSTTEPPKRPSESTAVANEAANKMIMGTYSKPPPPESLGKTMWTNAFDTSEQPPPGRTTNEMVIGLSRAASLAQTPATRSATLSQAQSGVASPANEDHAGAGTTGQSGAED
jgi:hypothetical protein